MGIQIWFSEALSSKVLIISISIPDYITTLIVNQPWYFTFKSSVFWCAIVSCYILMFLYHVGLCVNIFIVIIIAYILAGWPPLSISLIKSNQIKSNQIKSNQIKSNYIILLFSIYLFLVLNIDHFHNSKLIFLIPNSFLLITSHMPLSWFIYIYIYRPFIYLAYFRYRVTWLHSCPRSECRIPPTTEICQL